MEQHRRTPGPPATGGRMVPRGLSAAGRAGWADLAGGIPEGARFEAAQTDGLPEPVRRWLRHAVAEGTPLARAAELRMHGEIRIGRWAPFTAVERISVDGGFVWAATARPAGLPVIGSDRWTEGTGEMRWRLLGAVPVVSGAGEDVTRSAAGRHAGELLLAVPTAALAPEVTWRPVDTHRTTASVRVGGTTHEVTLDVGGGGALRALEMRRWGDIGSGSFGEQMFGADLDGELTSGGVTVPRRTTAGWHHGTDRWPEGQFIRWTVDAVVHG